MVNNTPENFNQPKLRPKFELSSKLLPEEIEQRFRNLLDLKKDQFTGKVRKSFVSISLPHKDQHYWSPQLSISFESSENGGSKVNGLFGPRPSVWTMFIFFYSLIAVAIFIINVIGLSRHSLDLPAKILWWNIPLIILFFSLYLIAFSGQRLGRDEMVKLRGFLNECLAED